MGSVLISSSTNGSILVLTTSYIGGEETGTINNFTAPFFFGDGSHLTGISGSGGNPFNQNLNITNNVSFNHLNVTNISFGGSDRYLSSNGPGDLELGMNTPASSLNIRSADSLRLFGNSISLTGNSELYGSLEQQSTSEDAFVVKDDVSYDTIFKVDTINQNVFAKSLNVNNNISFGGVDRYLRTNGAGVLELGSDNQMNIFGDSLYLNGNYIGINGPSEQVGQSFIFATSENAFGVINQNTGVQIIGVDTINGIVTINNSLKLEIINLPSCNSGTNGIIGRNATKLYFCDGITWNGLY
jgi:hypothetical protein